MFVRSHFLSLEHSKHLKQDVSRELQGCLKGVGLKFQGSFKEVSRMFQGSFKVFAESFERVSGKFKGEVSRVF